MPRLPLRYDAKPDLVSQLNANKTEGTDCGLDWVGSGIWLLWKRQWIFSVEASEAVLGLCKKLVNHCPDTIDQYQFTQIYKKFYPNSFKRSVGEAEERHDLPIMLSFYELGVKTD